MVFTLPSGVGAKKETVQKYVCGALNQLLPQNEVTATTPGGSTSAAAIALNAPTLAQQVAAAGGNPAKIRVNVADKTFRISGKVLSIVEGNGSYLVGAQVLPPSPQPLSHEGCDPAPLLHQMEKGLGDEVGCC
ncbi:MAG: hypothetical protein HC824_00515 [Synechococcales cyanobacterium RM1_1_8]|nr:hypothetical protein [Synechococcales cyanobacterium RM1_1_8]